MPYDQGALFAKDAPLLAREGVDAAFKALGTVSQGAQAIAVEMGDLARKSFEQGGAALGKLSGVRTLDKAVEVQSEYWRASYEGLVAGAGRVGTLYANLAKDAMKPYEALAAGRTSA